MEKNEWKVVSVKDELKIDPADIDPNGREFTRMCLDRSGHTTGQTRTFIEKGNGFVEIQKELIENESKDKFELKGKWIENDLLSILIGLNGFNLGVGALSIHVHENGHSFVDFISLVTACLIGAHAIVHQSQGYLKWIYRIIALTLALI